jgi:hypothetical protein
VSRSDLTKKTVSLETRKHKCSRILLEEDPRWKGAGVFDEAFMILILNEEAMSGAYGIARYRNEFDEAM